MFSAEDSKQHLRSSRNVKLWCVKAHDGCPSQWSIQAKVVSVVWLHLEAHKPAYWSRITQSTIVWTAMSGSDFSDLLISHCIDVGDHAVPEG